jgi:xylulokinase
MAAMYLLGIDIGTQGTKTGLFSQDGRKVAEAFEASRLIRTGGGVVQQEPDEMYGSVLRTIASVMEQSGVNPAQVAGIGVDGQMAGIIGIDRNWNAVTWYDSWLDTRCEKYIEFIKHACEEKVIAITGCPVTYAHGPKILWWKHEQPEIYKTIDKFILPSAYAVGRLAGLTAENAYIDYSHLHFSGFGDVEKMEWSEELLDQFQVDKSKMPRIVNPWDIVGCLTPGAAAQCGLIPGIPLVAGCGDSAATSLAAGVTRKGIIFDVAGTASIFSCCVDQYKPDLRNKTLLYARSIVPGLWIPMAYINGGGLCLKWFRDHLTGTGTPVSFGELDREAEPIVPGSEGLIFLPHFSGRVCPNNANVRGSWIGLHWTHQRGHLYKSIMEGIAYEYDHYFRIIRELVQEAAFSEVFVIGGGAKSTLFNAIKADVLGIDYVPLRISDTAPLGSALVAGHGVGLFPDLKAAADAMIGFEARIPSQGDRHKAYQKYADAYANVFEALGPTFKAILE